MFQKSILLLKIWRKYAKVTTRKAQENPREPQESPKEVQESSKRALRELKRIPRAAQERPGDPEENSKRDLRKPKTSKSQQKTGVFLNIIQEGHTFVNKNTQMCKSEDIEASSEPKIAPRDPKRAKETPLERAKRGPRKPKTSKNLDFP